jgi:dTDP-4-amino-4,6-dideoxygalactose transaminase
MDAVLTCLVSDSIGPGSLSHQLAGDLAAYLGVDPGVCVRDYATAIELSLKALNVEPGDQVILSPLAPAVYHSVLIRMGITPRMVDVDASSAALTADAVANASGPGVKAIIVHYTMGIIPDISALTELGIPIIEDISEGFGGITAERKIGTYGQYTIVGLEAEHVVTAGGGAVVLPVGKRERAELKRATDDIPREVILADMNAALGIQQVKRIEQFIEKRREIASIYHRAILRGRHKMLVQAGEADNVYYSFAVVLANGAREVIQYARKKQVEAVRAFEFSILGQIASRSTLPVFSGAPANQDAVFEKDVESVLKDFPKAQSLYLRCILFPLYPSLAKRDVERIEKVLTTLP